MSKPSNPPLIESAPTREGSDEAYAFSCITLWDIYFGMAMNSQALTPSETSFGTMAEPHNPWPWIAAQAADAADAMLAERAKREGE